LNYSKLFFYNKYLFSFITVFIGGLLWIFSNGFNISDISKGYDPFRYMDHALFGCFRNLSVCDSPIVNLLEILGNNSINVYLNFLILVFFLLTISISKKLLPYIVFSFPILIYYLPQTGKDSFTVLGSIATLSILIDISSRGIFFDYKKGIISKNILIIFLRIIVIGLGFFIRNESLFLYLIISYTFFTCKSLSINKKLSNKFFHLSLFIIILSFTINQLTVNGLDNYWLVQYIETEGMSNFGNERYAFLIGYGIQNYIARFIFYFFYSISIPLIFLTRFLLFNFSQGFVYFSMIALFVQHIILFKNKVITKFFINSIPYVSIISVFLFPHLRYFVIMYPAIICITLIAKDKFKILNL